MTTVTRADIAETICTEIGLSRKDAGDILDMVIDEIKGELIAMSKSRHSAHFC